MRKVFLIAGREYRAAVRTKGFIMSLVLMPVLMGGAIGLQAVVKRFEDRTERFYAVVDRTPGRELVKALAEATAERYNRTVIVDPKTGERTAPPAKVEDVPPSADSPDEVLRQRAEQSGRVERGEVIGLIDIGPDVTDPAVDSPAAPDERRIIRYQSDKLGDLSYPRWAERAINEAVQAERLRAAGISPAAVRAAQSPVRLVMKSLTRVDPVSGKAADAPDEQRAITFLLPAVLIGMMFMMIVVGATPAMGSVLEEKSNRVAELLLGSVTPFRLMLGKLLGMVGVSLTVAAVYLSAVYLVASRYGFTSSLPPGLLAWFLVYLVLAVFMYGSVFIAVGAACTDYKETQALLTPVMLVAALPVMLLGPVLISPNGTLATVASFVPTGTPMLMLARQSMPPGVPWWQPVVGVLGVLAAATVCVWAAGRVFRVGLLMQGKGASLRELSRWIARG